MGDIFDSKEFSDASENGGGVFFLPGQYPEVEVTELKMIESKQDACPVFIAEIKINESSVPERPAGTSAAFIVKLKQDKNIKTKMGDVKAFVAKCLNVAFGDVQPGHMRAAISSTQPLKGTKLALTATQIKIGKEEKPFTKHAFTHKALSPAFAAMTAAK